MIRLFHHYIPWAFLWLGFIEIASLVGAVWVSTSLPIPWLHIDHPMPPSDAAARGAPFVVIALISFMAVGLYQRRLREGITGIAIRVAVAFFFTVLILGAFYLLVPELALPRRVLLGVVVLSVALTLAARLLFIAVLSKSPALKRRILFLGAGKRAAHMRAFRRKTDRLTYELVGFVRMPGDSPEPEGVSPEHILATPKDGDALDLFTLVDEHRIDQIVVSPDDRRGGGLPTQQLLECKMNGIEVVDLLTHFEREHGIIKLDLIHPSWLIFSDGFRQGTWRTLAKRGFDIGSSILLLATLWPVMVIAGLAVWLESRCRGSIFYAQTRVGLNERPIKVLKFRSMREDAEADGKARWAQKNDSRITVVGAFLRNTRIDELPQLFNVLRGDMSFVGPRPERPVFVSELEKKIDYYGERHRVKPGITGWAQICYPYGASDEDAFNKLQYDLYYVKNYNLFFDFWVLLQTVEVILWNRGAR